MREIIKALLSGLLIKPKIINLEQDLKNVSARLNAVVSKGMNPKLEGFAKELAGLLESDKSFDEIKKQVILLINRVQLQLIGNTTEHSFLLSIKAFINDASSKTDIDNSLRFMGLLEVGQVDPEKMMQAFKGLIEAIEIIVNCCIGSEQWKKKTESLKNEFKNNGRVGGALGAGRLKS